MKSKHFKKILPITLWILGLSVCAIMGYKAYQYLVVTIEPVETGRYSQVVGDNSIVIFTRTSCPYCQSLKAYLDRADLDYLEHDIERSELARTKYHEQGLTFVPVIYTKKYRINGFNQQLLDEYLLNQPKEGL